MAASTPLTKAGESSVDSFLASCTASSIATGSGTSSARLRALDRAAIAASSVGAAEVPAVAGVELEPVAGVDEQRHLDLRAGLEGRRLGAAGGAVALQARVGVLDHELHGHRELHVQRHA